MSKWFAPIPAQRSAETAPGGTLPGNNRAEKTKSGCGAFAWGPFIALLALSATWGSIFPEYAARAATEPWPAARNAFHDRPFASQVVRLPPTGATEWPHRCASAVANGSVFAAMPPTQTATFAAEQARDVSCERLVPPRTSALSPGSLRIDNALSPEAACTGIQPGPQLRRWLVEGSRKARMDHSHYYSPHGLRDVALGIALAAPLANTSLDHDVRDWWQDEMRNTGTDNAATLWKVLGEGVIMVPAMACLGWAGHALSDQPGLDLLGEWGGRATRAYLVGAPPMLAMQMLLGASRPGETAYRSRWKPLDDNNAVSGHAFVGAVPWIAAAEMTENRAARAFLYLGSAGTAWSRVNDDAHYLSQAILGWYMAYLACRSVHATEHGMEPVTWVPLAGPEMSGFGMIWRR